MTAKGKSEAVALPSDRVGVAAGAGAGHGRGHALGRAGVNEGSHGSWSPDCVDYTLLRSTLGLAVPECEIEIILDKYLSSVIGIYSFRLFL